MKPLIATTAFIIHMALASVLFVQSSTPVAVDVPGLQDCPQNEYGGYEMECMRNRSARIDAYIAANPPAADFRVRDALSIVLAFVVGLVFGQVLHKNRIATVIVGIAYILPVLLGLVRMPSLLALAGGYLAVRYFWIRRQARAG